MYSTPEGENKGLSAKTIRGYHNFLHNVFELCRKEKGIVENPADDATPPSYKRKEAEYFEIDEILQIREAIKDEPMKYKMMLFTAPAITFITYINTKVSDTNNYEKPKPKGYVNDTIYNGFKYTECYDYPFQRTDQYTPNKELELSSDKAAQYINFGMKCIDKLYNIDYYTLMQQDDTILAELQDIYSSELLIIKGEEIPVIDYARELRNNFIENGITMKAKFLTDKGLIWQDNIC